MFLVSAMACKKSKNELLTIPLVENSSKVNSIGLKGVAEDIIYAKLQKKPECLLGSVERLVASEKYFFVVSRELYQFLRNGEFVRKIGKEGRGPGEYQAISDLSIDESSQRIYILTIKQILIFDFNGTFINSIPLKDKFPQSFDVIDKDNIVLQSGINPISLVSTEIINEEGESQLQINSRIYKSIESNPDGKSHNVVYEFKNNFFVKESRNDTVYKITENGLIPHYVYDLGKYKPPIVCPEAEWGKYAIIFRIFETENYIFTFFAHNGISCVAQYNKLTTEVQVSIPSDNPKEGIKNDFDNGTNFYMTLWSKYKTNQEEWIFPLDPISLSAYKNDSKITGNFKSLINQLDEDSNPIIMIIKLKE